MIYDEWEGRESNENIIRSGYGVSVIIHRLEITFM